jgi:hypothetical protein
VNIPLTPPGVNIPLTPPGVIIPLTPPGVNIPLGVKIQGTNFTPEGKVMLLKTGLRWQVSLRGENFLDLDSLFPGLPDGIF